MDLPETREVMGSSDPKMYKTLFQVSEIPMDDVVWRGRQVQSHPPEIPGSNLLPDRWSDFQSSLLWSYAPWSFWAIGKKMDVFNDGIVEKKFGLWFFRKHLFLYRIPFDIWIIWFRLRNPAAEWWLQNQRESYTKINAPEKSPIPSLNTSKKNPMAQDDQGA